MHEPHARETAVTLLRLAADFHATRLACGQGEENKKLCKLIEEVWAITVETHTPIPHLRIDPAHSLRSRALASIPHTRIDPARSRRSRALAPIPRTCVDPAPSRRSRTLAQEMERPIRSVKGPLTYKDVHPHFKDSPLYAEMTRNTDGKYVYPQLYAKYITTLDETYQVKNIVEEDYMVAKNAYTRDKVKKSSGGVEHTPKGKAGKFYWNLVENNPPAPVLQKEVWPCSTHRSCTLA